jgi:hypothetical protein
MRLCAAAAAGLETIQEQGPNSGLVQAFQQLSECRQQQLAAAADPTVAAPALAAVSGMAADGCLFNVCWACLQACSKHALNMH